jgi:class 3 adenylate cyclase/predicted ATPase/predicted nucleic acid-binding Zn ribbon protein
MVNGREHDSGTAVIISKDGSMDCLQCGAAIPDDARFCSYCGLEQTQRCPACGTASPPRARFCAACGASLAHLGESQLGWEGTPVTAALAPRMIDAERRQLTVLFSDLVDSSGLSERLDPEDLREVMIAYETACRQQVSQFDGAVIRIVGDGVLCSFGYPRAHENDAERAIWAGLKVVEAVGQLPASHGTRLRVRVGIATGLVVVTELMDNASGRSSEVAGTTPILAVRLQAIVPPDGVVVADSTRRLVGNVFSFEDFGSHQLKGFAEPVRAWRVLGRGHFSSRFEAFSVADEVTPLVGRREEVGLLVSRCEQAADGEGQVVLLSGEPGIGKSRMVHALRDRLSGKGYRFIYCYCSPYHQNTAFYPLTALFERTYQLSQDDPPEQRCDAFQAMVQGAAQEEDATVLLAKLMGVPGRPEPQTLTPQRERELIFEALLTQLFSLVGDQPAVLVFENAHWADPSSIELLRLILERIQTRPIAMIVTLRPERVLPWHQFPHVLELTLNRLTRKQCARMAEGVAQGRRLPASILDVIVGKTDGVPLFVEELTKTLLESRFLRLEGDAYVVGDRLQPMAVPVTLQDSLMARLDRLAPAREVAQIGAVIGREFSHELLASVSALPETALQAALEQLVDAGVLFQRGMPPRASYIFKHALMQDAASASLLRRKRQRLHAAIVEALEARAGEATKASLELLAHHCTEAALIERAVAYWTAAGEHASQRSACAEAVGHYRRAQALLETLEDNPTNREQQLKLMVALGPALIMSGGPGTPDVQAAYRRALELGAELPESPLHFAAHWGWWRISMDLRDGRERANSLLALGERLDDPGLLLQAHHCQWATLFNLGDHTACCAHIEEGLALYDPKQHGGHAFLYGGHDPQVCGLGERALSLWLLGYPEQALASAEEGVGWARALCHAGSLAHSMDQSVMLHRYRRSPDDVQREAKRMIEFSGKQALADQKIKGEFFCGWARAMLGEPTEGLAEMEQALKEQCAIGTAEDFPVYHDMLAEVLGLLGRVDEALSAIDRAFEAAERSGLAYWNPELHRHRAELLWRRARRPIEEARESLAAALALSRSQNARSLELRAAMTAVRMAEGDAERRTARGSLQQLYERFSEGFGTVDLNEAGRLLGAGAP